MPPTRPMPFLDALPASAALRDARTGRFLDRAALCAEVESKARQMASQGLGAGSRTVIATTDPIALVTALFAGWSLGAMTILAPPNLTPTERRELADWVQPQLWIGDCAPDLATKQTAIPKPIGPDETALVLMTSGTTGRPKGVELSLRALMACCALNTAHIGAETMASTLCLLPLHFGHGLIGNVLTPLRAGATVHLRPSPQMMEWAEVAKALDRDGITFLSSVPVHWQMLTRLPAPKTTTLRRVHIGSAPLSRQAWEGVAAWTGTRNVWNMFGMTECANWIGGAALDSTHLDGAIGTVWGGAAAVLADGHASSFGEGELLIHSPSLMQGYFEDPDRTENAFFGTWFRTGDVAEISADGTIRLCGRLKSEINRAGLKVHPEEVEMRLEAHPDVVEACAYGLPDSLAGEIVGASVVAQNGADPEELIAWLQDHLRAEAVPARLTLVDALPRSDRGKVLRDIARNAALKEG